MKLHLPTILAKVSRTGIDPEDSADIQLQKTLLASASVMIILATLLWGGIFIAYHELPAALISLFYSAVTLISLFLYRINHRFKIFTFTQLLMGLFLPFLHTLLLGGIMSSSAVILWSLISPLGALIFYRQRQAIVWWLAFLALITISAVLQPYLKTSNNLPVPLINLFFVLNTGAVSGIFFFAIGYFINQKNLALYLLHIEEQKSENLLLNILPKEIAPILKNGTHTIADHYDATTILFADLVGFTPLTAQLAPAEMVSLLNEIYSHFDTLVEKYDLEKIRTIGDNYMVAAGVPRPRPDHAKAMACMALEMNAYTQTISDKCGHPIQFRIGINSGPVVGGVIGRRKFVFDIWGDAVNIASRMESQGVPGKIQIAQPLYEQISDQFYCEYRGTIPVKGWGEMDTWFLVREA